MVAVGSSSGNAYISSSATADSSTAYTVEFEIPEAKGIPTYDSVQHIAAIPANVFFIFIVYHTFLLKKYAPIASSDCTSPQMISAHFVRRDFTADRAVLPRAARKSFCHRACSHPTREFRADCFGWHRASFPMPMFVLNARQRVPPSDV